MEILVLKLVCGSVKHWVTKRVKIRTVAMDLRAADGSPVLQAWEGGRGGETGHPWYCDVVETADSSVSHRRS